MAHSRAVSSSAVASRMLILELLVSSDGGSRMAHSRAVIVLYLLEPVARLIPKLLVSFTCWRL